MMDQNLVSIIMPAFNSERFISEAIESVIKQTYPHWELIVVDDGSTDETQKIVGNYMRRDGRIRYVHQDNSGPAGARNRGIRESRGKYIAFLDSDDIWYPDKLEKQMNFLLSHPGHVVYGGRNYIREVNGKFIETGQIRFFKNFDTLRDNAEYLIFHPNMTITSTVLFEKDLLDRVGYFDDTLHLCEDDNLFIRMAMYSKFHALNEPMDYRRKHPDSLTGDGKDWGRAPYRFRAVQRALEQTPDRLHPDKKSRILSSWALRYASSCLEGKRYLSFFQWFWKGFFLNPPTCFQVVQRKITQMALGR